MSFRTIPYKATFSRAAVMHPGNGIRRSKSLTIFRTLTKIGDIGHRVALAVSSCGTGRERERKSPPIKPFAGSSLQDLLVPERQDLLLPSERTN
jgi:hypothetical protein